MRYIKLTNSDKFAFVSDEDYQKVCNKRWHLNKDGYAETPLWLQSHGIRGSISMHRVVMNQPLKKIRSKIVVDHINGNGLDNRRSNLQLVTDQQNLASQKKSKANTSGIKGVYWNKANKNWMAIIGYCRKLKYLGCFKDKEEAGRAYNEAAIKLFGKYAKVE